MDIREKEESIDLGGLMKSVSQQILKDKETYIGDLMRKMLSKEAGIIEDIKRMTSELNKKNDALKQIQERRLKIVSGDWDLLVKLDSEFNQKRKEDPKEETKE